MTGSNSETARTFLRALASGDADLAATCLNPNRLIQHDPAMADGIDGVRAHAGERPAGAAIEIVRMLDDAPFVVAHGRDGAGDGTVFFAVFRFVDGGIAEHWRFTAPVAPPNPSGHTQLDGPTAPDHAVDGERSKALVRAYYETVHIAGQHDQIGRYMSGNRQVRHEPGVRDGVAAFEQDLRVLTRDRTIDRIVLLAGEGDLVFIAAKGTHDGEFCAYLDVYRVEADRLVEHWGFPQAMPPVGSRNNNGPL